MNIPPGIQRLLRPAALIGVGLLAGAGVVVLGNHDGSSQPKENAASISTPPTTAPTTVTTEAATTTTEGPTTTTAPPTTASAPKVTTTTQPKPVTTTTTQPVAVITTPVVPVTLAPAITSTTSTTVPKPLLPECQQSTRTTASRYSGMTIQQIRTSLALVETSLSTQTPVVEVNTTCRTAYQAGKSLKSVCGPEPTPQNVDLTGLTIDQIRTRLAIANAGNQAALNVYSTCGHFYYEGKVYG